MGTFADAGTVKYPTGLLEHPHWYALRTRPRHEKQTHRLLTSAGHESFAAIARVERQWADRTRKVRLPLFAGYIFVRIELVHLGDVLCWPGALDLVRTNGVPVPVREEEMDAVIRLAGGSSQSRTPPAVVDYLEPGVKVRVEEGPFAGMVGRLLEHRGSAHVAVRLDALRLARAVEIGRSRVVRLSD